MAWNIAYSPSLSGGGTPDIFFDNFNYTVARSDPNSSALSQFQSGGWAGVKRLPTDTNSFGYIYTTTSISGFSGTYPGTGKACALEGLPNNSSDPSFKQTDYYLQIGNESTAVIGDLPANIWFQFWIYVNSSGSELSTFANRNKFIYQTTANYPATTGQEAYLVLPGSRGFEEIRTSGVPSSFPSNELFLAFQPPDADNTNSTEYPTNATKLYQNLDNTVKILPNQWWLVKIHADVSGTQGILEAWLCPQGGSWTKVCEWEGGVTSGFTWPTGSNTWRSGHRLLRIPTTENASPLSGGDGDNWKYIQDFAIASTESLLPIY